VCSVADFEVIDIAYGSTLYPTLLGLDWEFSNQMIIDLKKRQMVFETKDLKVTTPLDPIEGQRYVELEKRKGLDNFYI
jgi:hypothetical protein